MTFAREHVGVSVLARLQSALEAGDEATSVLLAELGVARPAARALRSQALSMLERARNRPTQASTTEVELALGALLALNMKPGAAEDIR